MANRVLRAKTRLGSSIDLSQIEATATLNGTPSLPKTRVEAILKTKMTVIWLSVCPKACADDDAPVMFCNSTKETIIDKCKELDGEATELIELYESNKNHIFQNVHLCSVKHPYTGRMDNWCTVNGKRPIPESPSSWRK